MMLNMSNKFQDYQRTSGSGSTGLLSSSPSTATVAGGCSADFAAAMSTSSLSRSAERESIHSGQFMVSHFEAEEAQDDLDDGEVKMLDPEDPSLSKQDEPNTCMEVQLYVPIKAALMHGHVDHKDVGLLTSHLEIETSLTKLFKCMNLAYSQKLTSPKWNHFKGVRLRWKDKIRLNNVIWRCWHMQFILKRKTPVCQFASPLDVDIHSNPQSVVLEGKYWKRQLAVIKAEYRKWRRNFKSSATGCLTYDTRSEFDLLEWSPFNDRSLMLSEDWTSDTLFSAINGPFPFPDPREIARGAGIADFIQPSLGPLQPNLEDIELPFSDLLQHVRLPPVPEEGTDDMLKNVDYSFSAIMGSEQMDSSSMMDVSSSNNNSQMPSSGDSNMLELNTPLNAMQYSDIEQQFAVRESRNVVSAGDNLTTDQMITDDAIMTDERSGAVLLTNVITSTSNNSHTQLNHYSNMSPESAMGRQSCNDYPNKSVIKGRISKNFQRPFRREPHNYDKAQPTMHQTTIYQQMLAEQQKSHQQLLQPNIASNVLQHQAVAYQNSHQQQQQPQMQYNTAQYPQSPPQLIRSHSANSTGSFALCTDASNNLGNANNVNNNLIRLTGSTTNIKDFGLLSAPQNMPAIQGNMTNQTHPSTQSMMINVKVEPPSSSDVLSMLNMSAKNNDIYTGSSNSYKPYPNIANFKKSASVGAFINMRNISGNNNAAMNANQAAYMQQDQTQSNMVTATQMHANSLPLSLGDQLPNLSSALHLQLQNAQTQSSQQQQQQQQVQHQRQQHQLIQQQQHQAQQHAQQQQQAQQHALPKEMIRSNSLPLNVTFQKLNQNFLHDNFAVPKYTSHHVKTSNSSGSAGKPRSRSNSIQHQQIANTSLANNSGFGGNSGNNLMISSQLQAATSDPMLNSTLAQLLTTNTRMPTLVKNQSSSTSAIATISIQMNTPPTITMSTVQQPTVPTNSLFLCSSNAQQQQHVVAAVPVTMPLAVPGPKTSPTTAKEMLQQEQQQQLKRHIYKQEPVHNYEQQQQPKSPKKSTSLPAPATSTMLHSPPASKMLSYPLTGTSHVSLSPESFHESDSPLSPTHSVKFPRDNQRRAGHIHAEQKRRYNIKNGFDMLHSLIPQLQQNPNAKLSKAALLQKGADHIKHLRAERNVLKEKMEALRMERDALNNSLTHLHSILPANGAPVTRQGTEQVRRFYEQYVRYRTMNNWKFYILGLILEPLLTSYTSSVSSASMEELRRTAFLWVDQHCSLIDLRPAVSNKLKYLSLNTDILSDPPSTLKDEVIKAVNNTSGQHPNLHGT